MKKVEEGYEFTNEKAIINNIIEMWDYEWGDFEELFYKLAEKKGFESITATCYTDHITYDYILNDKGEKIAINWANDYEYAIPKKIDYFCVEGEESVENIYSDWGIEVEEE